MVLIFDLDGTLTDSKEGITKCVQYTLKHFGIEADCEDLLPFIGPPLIDSFMKFYGMDEGQAKIAVQKYRERFSPVGKSENKVYDGIPELLAQLKHEGIQLAVGSSKPEVFVKDILDHFDLAKYFDVIVGSCLDGSMVDKEDIIREVWRRIGGKEETIMIGDRIFDVEGAKKAGVPCVAVTYGFGSESELASADFQADSVNSLEEVLFKTREVL